MAQFIQVRVKGARETFLYLKRVKARTKKEGIKLSKRMAMIIQRKAKEFVAPYNTGTGDLRRSIQVFPMKGRRGYTVVAGRGLKRPYAIMQERGFKPHWVHKSKIDPRARGNWWGGRRGLFFVKHWTPYMTPAFNYAMSRIDSEMSRTANKIIR